MDARVRPRDGAATALAWLGHPATVVALVVLLLNDHLLKAAFPGPVTGKLSDVAGLVLTPPLVAVLLTLAVPRLPVRAAVVVGLVSVGAGFAVVKSSGYAAELASAAWTALAVPSLIRADVTDLFTLPALGLAWWSWTRSRHRPVGERTTRSVRLVVLLPSAVLAVAATSPAHYPYALGTSSLDGQPAIATGSGYSGSWPEGPGEGAWWLSGDGGHTWRSAEPDEFLRLRSTAGYPRTQGCTPAGDRCYRVVAGRLRVEESDDGGRSWRTSWEVSEAQREALARRYPEPGDVDRHFSSRELVVFSTEDGHGVLVANGRDGFAFRHPDGRWERVGSLQVDWEQDTAGWDRAGVPALEVGRPTQRPADILLALGLTLTLGVGVVAAAAHFALRRAGGSRLWGAGAALATATMAALLASVWQRADEFAVLAVVLVLVLPLGAVTLAGMLVVAAVRNPGAWDGWWGGVLRAFLTTVLLAGLPLAGWLLAAPQGTWTAVPLALLAALPGLWLARRAARLADPARTPATNPPYPPVRT